MDMAFDMVDTNERQIAGQAERLRVGDADQQRAYQAGTLGDCDGDQVLETCGGDECRLRTFAFEQRICGKWTSAGDCALARKWSREASSGTTPPYFACVASWEATTEE